MKILHTADLHLGKVLNGYSLIEDQRYILNKIKDIIINESIDAVVIAGDIFDRAITNQESLDLFANFLEFIYKNNKHLIAILGNHDGERIAYLNKLLRLNNINIITEPSRLKINDVTFYAIPYFNLNQFKEYYNEDFKNLDEAYSYVIDDFQAKENEFNFLIAHDYFRFNDLKPEESDSEVKNIVGGLNDVDASILKNFNYVALGHLHRSQHIGLDTIRYSGSILKYSFSEVDQQKSVMIIDSNGSYYKIPLIPSKDLKVIIGSIDELTNPEFYKNYNYTNDYFKVILHNSEIDAYSRLKAVYTNLMEISIEQKSVVRELERKIVAERNYLKLFESFYLEMTGEELTDEEKQIIQNYFEGVEK